MDVAAAIGSIVFVVVIGIVLYWKSRQRSFGTPSKTKEGGGVNREQP